MKRFLKTVLILALALTLAIPSFAADVPETFSADDIVITLDYDLFFPTDANGVYVPPFIENGSTYVPLRALAEAFDLSVSWEQETKTVYIGEKGGNPTLSDNINICIDGKEFEARDAAGNRVYPILKEGTTYMPLRAIGEAFGKNVAWDNVKRCVYITTPPSDEDKALVRAVIESARAENTALEMTVRDNKTLFENGMKTPVNMYLSYFLTDDMLSSCRVTKGVGGDGGYFTLLLPPDEFCKAVGFDKAQLQGTELEYVFIAGAFNGGKITGESLSVTCYENDDCTQLAITIEPIAEN